MEIKENRVCLSEYQNVENCKQVRSNSEVFFILSIKSSIVNQNHNHVSSETFVLLYSTLVDIYNLLRSHFMTVE